MLLLLPPTSGSTFDVSSKYSVRNAIGCVGPPLVVMPLHACWLCLLHLSASACWRVGACSLELRVQLLRQDACGQRGRTHPGCFVPCAHQSVFDWGCTYADRCRAGGDARLVLLKENVFSRLDAGVFWKCTYCRKLCWAQTAARRLDPPTLELVNSFLVGVRIRDLSDAELEALLD